LQFDRQINVPSVVLVMAGTVAFVTAATIAATPALRIVRAGAASSFAVVGPYLLLVVLAGLGLIAAAASWIHDRSVFNPVSIALWTMTAVATPFRPGPSLWFALFALAGTLVFREAERSGAHGLAFSFRSAEPSGDPPRDRQPGSDLSRTRSGIIEAYRHEHQVWDERPEVAERSDGDPPGQ